MAIITPFKGLRPKVELVKEVASLPYDVCNVEEARAYANQPFHFFHVTRSEIDLPVNTDVHSAPVYEKAKENLKRFIDEGTMFVEEKPCYYIYRLTMHGHSQSGLLCASSVEDYENGIIKKHEFTRPEKEQDRIDHITTTRAQTGVVLMTYREVKAVSNIIDAWIEDNNPTYTFISEDGIGHDIWVINEDNKINEITRLFAEEVPATYIADGHHRAASAAKVAHKLREEHPGYSGDEAFNYFLTAIFPSNQMRIMDYNRVVKDLNNYSEEEFLNLLSNDFEISEAGLKPYRPTQLHEFGLYLDSKWYCLNAKTQVLSNDAVEGLDVSLLQKNVLDKLLDIKDPRTNNRVEFVGGIRGLGELVKRVDSGEMKAAFSCHPVSMDELLAVADSGNVMPPKSTWFEPKTRDGLVVHLI